MKYERIGYLLLLLIVILVVSTAALSAQNPNDALAQATAEATADGTAEVLFNDLRVNNQIILGEFGIFCEDANGTATTTYEGGRISVYGANGEQYITVPEAALRQLSDTDGTTEPTVFPTNTLRPNITPTQRPFILLGQGLAANGLVQLFLAGDNEFRLTGFLPDGKGFIYGWTGCSGNTRIDTFDGAQAYITTTPVATLSGMVTAQPTRRPTLAATVATTEEATTSP